MSRTTQNLYIFLTCFATDLKYSIARGDRGENVELFCRLRNCPALKPFCYKQIISFVFTRFEIHSENNNSGETGRMKYFDDRS